MVDNKTMDELNIEDLDLYELLEIDISSTTTDVSIYVCVCVFIYIYIYAIIRIYAVKVVILINPHFRLQSFSSTNIKDRG